MLSLADLVTQMERVNKRTPIDVDDIIRKVETHLLQVFPVGEGSVIVAGMETTSGRAHIFAAAGDLGDLLTALPHVENWYGARGALRLTLTGRVGWKRKLKGYHERDGVLFKELN